MYHLQRDTLKRLDSCRQQLNALREVFRRFAKLLELEYQIVIAHDIKKLEQVCHEKAAQSEAMQELFGAVQEDMRALSALYGEASGEPMPATINFSLSGLGDLVTLLVGHLAAQLPAGSRAVVKLEKQGAKLRADIDTCLHEFWQLKPEIEKNRLVTSRLLHNHQESYKFWRASVTEASSSYDQSGARRPPDSISQFHTKV